ncbi:hypothetical protein PAPYR_11503 [Paratrimastix pyriformis]|uniref:Uncharacterized protein n=1 Tax=Paratrimastix pyriformis TaxID=342808 RepID=A0ABQ8U7F4_9EUKA|nr:hypothetical protein PAPYR_11503 [Paratrimastix pyriformis]
MPEQKRARVGDAAQPALTLSDLPQPLFKLVVLYLLDDDEDEYEDHTPPSSLRKEHIRSLLLVSRDISRLTSEIFSMETLDYAALVQTANPFTVASPDQTGGKEAILLSRLEVLRTQRLANQTAARRYLVGMPDTVDGLVRQTLEEVAKDLDTLRANLVQDRARLADYPETEKYRGWRNKMQGHIVQTLDDLKTTKKHARQLGPVLKRLHLILPRLQCVRFTAGHRGADALGGECDNVVCHSRNVWMRGRNAGVVVRIDMPWEEVRDNMTGFVEEGGLPCEPVWELSPECQEDGHGNLPIFLELKESRLVVLHIFEDSARCEKTISSLLSVSRQINRMTSELFSLETMNYAEMTHNPFVSASPAQTGGRDALLLSRLEVLRARRLSNAASAHRFLAGLPNRVEEFIREFLGRCARDGEDEFFRAQEELTRIPDYPHCQAMRTQAEETIKKSLDRMRAGEVREISKQEGTVASSPKGKEDTVYPEQPKSNTKNR